MMMKGVWQRVRRNEEGLTLIELIVVVAIIGVLAWLVTPRVLSTLNDSKVNSAESVANEILASLERYAAQNTGYPVTAAIDAWAEIPGVLDLSVSTDSKIVDTAAWVYQQSASDVFCAVLKAKDKDGTTFKIEKTGVKKTPGATCA